MRTLALALTAALAGCSSTASDPRPPGGGAQEHAALPNLHRLSEGVLSGGVPAGDAAFAELAAMGVRTVISVDGATPDVEAARRHGLRYVHVPITYSEVADPQRLELARAIRDLPGSVYIHCHHGKHRSAAAAAAAGVTLGLVTPDEGVAYMTQAGTAPRYEGLWTCVSRARPAAPAELDAAPAEFPAVRAAEGIVAAMVEVDLAFEHLGRMRAAGWRVPADHPDLVPAAEAGRLADNLRLGARDDPAGRGEGFALRLQQAVEQAEALEQAIVAGAPAAELEPRWRLVSASCRDCHRTYRDRSR